MLTEKEWFHSMLHLYHDHHPDMCDRVSVTPEPRDTGPVWGITETWRTDNRLRYYSSRWQILALERMDVEIRLTSHLSPSPRPAGYTGIMTNGICSAAVRGSALRLLIYFLPFSKLTYDQHGSSLVTALLSSEQVLAWQSWSLVSGTHNSLLNIYDRVKFWSNPKKINLTKKSNVRLNWICHASLWLRPLCHCPVSPDS